MKWALSAKRLIPILILGTVLRLLWVYFVNTQPIFDFKHYHDLAMSLLHNGSYTMPEGLDYIKQSTDYIQQGVQYPTAFRPPGYPFLLAAIYAIWPSILAAKLANVFFGMVWIVCAYLLGRKYFNERVGLWAAFLTAIFPPAIGYTSILGTEVFSVALLLFILCLQVYRIGGRITGPLIQGALIGFLALVKPYFAVFPILHLIIMWWLSKEYATPQNKRRQIKEVVLPVVYATIAMAIMISPWTVRNYIAFDRFVPISTNGDFVLYINNNDLNQGLYMDAMKVPDSIFKTDRILDENGNYNEPDAMKAAKSEAVKWILSHPKKFFFLGLDRLAASYFSAGDEVGYWSMPEGNEARFNKEWVKPLIQGSSAFSLIVVGGGLVYALIILYQFIRFRPMNVMHKLNLMFIAFLTVVIFFSEGQPRYMFPLYPFFILGIAWMGDLAVKALRFEGVTGQER